MADSAIAITAGTGTSVDTRTEATNGHHRQVVVIGDPATNAGVAPVDATNGLAVDVKASALPTGAATSAKQDTGNTSLASIDGKITAVNTGAVVVSSSALPSGASTAAKQPALGTAGTPSADVISVQGVTSMTPIKVDGSGVTQPVSGTVAITNAGITTIAGAVSGTEMQVDVLTMPTVTVTATNLDVQSGGTDLATSAQGAAIQTAVEALDNSVDGNYLNVNMNITGTDVSTTNAIPTKGVPSDIDINGSNANHTDKYYTNAGAVTDGIVWSPAAGKRWHITTLYINVSAAATVTLEDDLAAGDNVRWKGELAANSGVVLTYDKEHPFSSGEDAADLLITTSAGNVYVQAVGYEV